MVSKSLLIGTILVHALLISHFSFISNASNSQVSHGSFLDSPHKLIKTIKRGRLLLYPPPPKLNVSPYCRQARPRTPPSPLTPPPSTPPPPPN
ncbi:hypothetical protein JHK82_037086 [Glycine max]|nr:hypothetical protein JHK82_037086 [Glycine max]KAH1217924.1 hypothetical protein GmHk_13G038463 [Glycine max]